MWVHPRVSAAAKVDIPTDPGFLLLGSMTGPVTFENSSQTRTRISLSRHASGWIPQFGVQGEWLLIRFVVDQHLPCFDHAARGRRTGSKVHDPISDPILDPDSFGWFCPSSFQNSDPNLDFEIGSQIGSIHFGVGAQSRTPSWTAKWALMFVLSWVYKRTPNGARLLLVQARL